MICYVHCNNRSSCAICEVRQPLSNRTTSEDKTSIPPSPELPTDNNDDKANASYLDIGRQNLLKILLSRRTVINFHAQSTKMQLIVDKTEYVLTSLVVKLIC